MTDWTHSTSLLLGRAPILMPATWTFLNMIRVGIPRTPYFIGVCGFSSMFNFATVTLPFMSVAMSSRNGAIILQGPHHSAQKSTSTGPGALRTSSLKDWSLILVVLALMVAPVLASKIRGVLKAASRYGTRADGRRECVPVP